MKHHFRNTLTNNSNNSRSDTDEDDAELVRKFIQEESLSDTEAVLRRAKELKVLSQGAPDNWLGRYGNFLKEGNLAKTGYFRINDEANLTDDDVDREESIDEFGNNMKVIPSSKLVKTGRQRKKSAARTKGGEFQARRKKKRIYFCCISSEIDVQKLEEHLIESGTMNDWQFRMYSDVLHIHKPGNTIDSFSPRNGIGLSARAHNTTVTDATVNGVILKTGSQVPTSLANLKNQISMNSKIPIAEETPVESSGLNENTNHEVYELSISQLTLQPKEKSVKEKDKSHEAITEDTHTRISAPGSQEVFIFEFGAVVFWGFSRGEEAQLLHTTRKFIIKGFVESHEFPSGEDDMAFVTLPDTDAITISNDVLTVSEDIPAKQRLSVSFAIAQSAVLAIFESRIDRKILEYKHIPDHMATHGRIEMSERQLGMMIGEVYVIRHDVNLHSEILDTPDFFWKDGEKYEADYKLTVRYLEMATRAEVLNKRLNMLLELLDVLQQQMENAHGVKLELIVIWLIVVEVVLQAIAIAVDSIPKRTICI